MNEFQMHYAKWKPDSKAYTVWFQLYDNLEQANYKDKTLGQIGRASCRERV